MNLENRANRRNHRRRRRWDQQRNQVAVIEAQLGATGSSSPPRSFEQTRAKLGISRGVDISSPRSAIQDYGAPALRLLGARQVFLGFGVNWTSMNNDISRCGFRNLRMFVIIVLTRNTPDYFARERLYCSTFVHLW
jgi:hypothetical protein